jgi:hypothetical protein
LVLVGLVGVGSTSAFVGHAVDGDAFVADLSYTVPRNQDARGPPTGEQHFQDPRPSYFRSRYTEACPDGSTADDEGVEAQRGTPGPERRTILN